jgi:AbrB family looped-hinge helix DNA binding protein
MIDMENVKTESATLSSKFQVLIPKGIRDSMDLKAGQQFDFLVKGNLIQLLPRRSIKDMRGALKGTPAGEYRDRGDRV